MIIGLNGFGVRLLCPGTDTAVAADTATKAGTDVAAAGAADAGATAAGTAALDTAGTAALADAGATAGTAALADTAGTAALGADAAGTGAGLSEITVTAPALAASGGGTSALVPAAASIAGGLGAAGGGGPSATPQAVSADPSSSAAPADTGPGILAATSPGDISQISPDTLQMLGVDTSGGAAGMGDTTGTALDPMFSEDPSMLDAMTPQGTLDQGGLTSWLKNPKNLATAGLLGMSGMNALFPPKLPSAARQAQGAAAQAVQTATMTINTGGTGSPAWPGIKASIDAQVNQEIQQQTESIMQAAANSGMQGPGAPTGVVAEQIASMTAQANTQRQALYEQALSRLVGEAVQELSGADSVLTAIANEQLALDQEARQSAGQTAQLALLLSSLGG